jgi:hypothetical protein
MKGIDWDYSQEVKDMCAPMGISIEMRSNIALTLVVV